MSLAEEEEWRLFCDQSATGAGRLTHVFHSRALSGNNTLVFKLMALYIELDHSVRPGVLNMAGMRVILS